MAITHLGKQVTKETETVQLTDASIPNSYANDGRLAKLGGTSTNATQAGAQLATAITDDVLGVIQNIAGATLPGSNPGPSLDSNATQPGGTPKTATLMRQGNAVCRFDSTGPPAINEAVVPFTDGKVLSKTSPDPGDTVIGNVINTGGAIPNGGGDHWGIVRLKDL